MGSIKDKIAGTAKQVEGKLTGDKTREAQGTVQKAVGKVEDVAETVVDKVKDAAHAVEDKVRGTAARADRATRDPE